MQTAALGILFVVIAFFGLPRAFIGLNESLDWPEFGSAHTRVLGWLLILAGITVLVASARTGLATRSGFRAGSGSIEVGIPLTPLTERERP